MTFTMWIKFPVYQEVQYIERKIFQIQRNTSTGFKTEYEDIILFSVIYKENNLSLVFKYLTENGYFTNVQSK